MCLPPRREDIGYNHLEAVARALGNGLDPQNVVQEIYHVHLNFAWGRDAVFRPPLDVLRAGIGGCGHINILMGLLLELNGIRCRGVAGFDPVLREIYPGAGHSSIEFLNAASNKWEYLDAYLDVHLKGRAACDLPDDPNFSRNIIIADVGSEFDHMRYGAHINIARIFGTVFILTSQNDSRWHLCCDWVPARMRMAAPGA